MPLGRSRKTRWTEIEWDTSALAYADDVNRILIDAGKEAGLEINVEKTGNMLLFHHQNSCKNSKQIT
jgi:hypothetical protein